MILSSLIVLSRCKFLCAWRISKIHRFCSVAIRALWIYWNRFEVSGTVHSICTTVWTMSALEYTDSSLRSHEFVLTILNVDIKYQLLKMKDSIFLWIGDQKTPLLSDLSYGIQPQYSSYPITTKILGTASPDLTSTMMAERLCKKLNKPVYVSFNLPVTSKQMIEEIEMRLNEEMQLNRDMFYWISFCILFIVY